MSTPPRIGVAAILVRDGRVLLGRRLGAHGAGTWQFPGGHLEPFERVEACAAREALEECGLVMRDSRRGPWTDDHFTAEGKHYVTLFVIGAAPDGEPEVREPAKCAEWRWYDWDALPEPLFLPIIQLRALGFRP